MNYKNVICIIILNFLLNNSETESLSYTNRKKPVVIAHRGASGYLPEHSFAAKVAGILMNADYVEQDVVLTKDNVPLVLHDIYLGTL